ncbi:MAG: hypothetical protein AB7I41_10140 [Candidatus Sericytochromatia bacterium]
MPQLERETVIFDFVSTCDSSGSLPTSLEAFAELQGYEKQALQALFPTLLALEQAVYLSFFEQTLNLLERDTAYLEYGLQERVLALYYTLFELFGANRTYLELSLKQGLGEWQNLPKLKGLKEAFGHHVRQLFEPTLQPLLGLFKPLQTQALSEAAWLQFLSLLGFWLRDRSPDRGRSDMLIEKSVAASLEIWSALNWNHTPDLLRFWIEELLPKQEKK